MKKFIAIICMLLSLAMFVSCAGNNIEEDQNSAMATEIEEDQGNEMAIDKEPVKYVIYTDYSLGNAVPNTDGSKLEIKSAEEKTFSFKNEKVIERLDSAVDTYSFTVAGKTYKAKFSQSYETAAGASEKVRKYSKYSTYFDPMTTEIYITVNATTEEVEFFLNGGSDILYEDGDVTEERAKEIAEAIIKEMYGENALDKYEYISSNQSEMQEKKRISVNYTRKVWGFNTEDTINVTLNMQGELYSINALGRGAMFNAEKEVTKEEIENAIAALKNNYSANWNMHDNATLVIDTEGDYYVRMGMSTKTEAGTVAMLTYINVQ